MSASREQVKEWLDAVTYQSGWSFELHDDYKFQFEYEISIRILQKTADSDGRAEGEIKVGSVEVVPRFITTRAEFYHWFARRLISREAHETLEWLHAGGQRIFDPHPGGASTDSPSHYLLDDVR